jgi:putative component of membrane protein insertase Oxa1/YidC/SpoIIIJ protein YidD
MLFKILLVLLPIIVSAKEPFEQPWGKDLLLLEKPVLETKKDLSIATRIADRVIRFHQEVISPVDGPRSHFRPTSSRYMQLAMQRYGFWKGFLMGCDRLLRENDEEWVYRTVEIDGQKFKYDPAWQNKYHGMR